MLKDQLTREPVVAKPSSNTLKVQAPVIGAPLSALPGTTLL